MRPAAERAPRPRPGEAGSGGASAGHVRAGGRLGWRSTATCLRPRGEGDSAAGDRPHPAPATEEAPSLPRACQGRAQTLQPARGAGTARASSRLPGGARRRFSVKFWGATFHLVCHRSGLLLPHGEAPRTSSQHVAGRLGAARLGGARPPRVRARPEPRPRRRQSRLRGPVPASPWRLGCPSTTSACDTKPRGASGCSSHRASGTTPFRSPTAQARHRHTWPQRTSMTVREAFMNSGSSLAADK